MTQLTAMALIVAFAGCGGDDRAAAPDLDTELLAAAAANEVERARELIGDGADVNAKDASQESAYLIATSEIGDDPRLLELTLENGADVNARDSFDGTGLIRAAERGYVRIVRRLLETDIDIDHVNRLGWTALLEAIILGEGGRAHTETVRALVDAGADATIPDGDGVTPLTTPSSVATTPSSRSYKRRSAAWAAW
jgi:uncharacterized protein